MCMNQGENICVMKFVQLKIKKIQLRNILQRQVSLK